MTSMALEVVERFEAADAAIVRLARCRAELADLLRIARAATRAFEKCPPQCAEERDPITRGIRCSSLTD